MSGAARAGDDDANSALPAAQILTKFGVPFELSIVSAHRTAMRMEEFAHGEYNESTPSRTLALTGTPTTGRVVALATMPGK
jgi:phosphoribosylcarboxyaminoimidazole (NCAIR) mutase